MVSAERIRARTWHPSQKIGDEPDGGIVLTLQIADLDEVKWLLIGFGAEAKILKPSQLLEDVAAECRRLLAGNLE